MKAWMTNWLGGDQVPEDGLRLAALDLVWLMPWWLPYVVLAAAALWLVCIFGARRQALTRQETMASMVAAAAVPAAGEAAAPVAAETAGPVAASASPALQLRREPPAPRNGLKVASPGGATETLSPIRARARQMPDRTVRRPRRPPAVAPVVVARRSTG